MPRHPQYRQPETQTGAEEEEEGRGPKRGGGKNPRKSTQNHLTLEHIGVELWVSGGTPPEHN